MATTATRASGGRRAGGGSSSGLLLLRMSSAKPVVVSLLLMAFAGRSLAAGGVDSLVCHVKPGGESGNAYLPCVNSLFGHFSWTDSGDAWGGSGIFGGLDNVTDNYVEGMLFANTSAAVDINVTEGWRWVSSSGVEDFEELPYHLLVVYGLGSLEFAQAMYSQVSDEPWGHGGVQRWPGGARNVTVMELSFLNDTETEFGYSRQYEISRNGTSVFIVTTDNPSPDVASPSAPNGTGTTNSSIAWWDLSTSESGESLVATGNNSGYQEGETMGIFALVIPHPTIIRGGWAAPMHSDIAAQGSINPPSVSGPVPSDYTNDDTTLTVQPNNNGVTMLTVGFPDKAHVELSFGDIPTPPPTPTPTPNDDDSAAPRIMSASAVQLLLQLLAVSVAVAWLH